MMGLQSVKQNVQLLQTIRSTYALLLNISTNVDGLNDKNAPDAGAVSGS
jgi:hypothetical protein